MCCRMTRVLLALCLLLSHYESAVNAMPYSGDHSDAEIVVVRERVRYRAPDENKVATTITTTAAAAASGTEAREAQNTPKDNVDNESVMDTADDLIFLAKKPKQQDEYENIETTATQNTQQQQKKIQQQEEHQAKQSVEVYQQIDLLTSDEEDSLLSTSKEEQEQEQEQKQERHINGSPHAIELDTDDQDEQTTITATTTTTTTITTTPSIASPAFAKPIDMSAFMAIIPAAEVKAIAINYYHNDPEVQRVYAFLGSREFALLRHHVLALPEMAAFLKYLNTNGLDLVQFAYALTNLTNQATVVVVTEAETVNGNGGTTATTTTTTLGNEIEQNQYKNLNNNHTTTGADTQTTSTPVKLETSTKKRLNGLHGLVDSILATLPQDQILALFFDKLETDEQFTKLVDSFSKPEFSRILSDIQHSAPLRHLIFTLQNNGIQITRIADSLKAYFILGNLK